MKCIDYRSALLESLDFDVDAETRRRLDRHCEACPRCYAYTWDIVRNREALGRLPDADLPEGFHERLMARIGAAKRPLCRKSRAAQRILAPLAAALLLLMIGRGIYLDFSPQRLNAPSESGIQITALDPQAEAVLDKATEERFAAPMAAEEASPRIFHPLTLTALSVAGGLVGLGVVYRKRG